MNVKSPELVKNTMLVIPLTVDEKNKIRCIAESMGISLASFSRLAIRRFLQECKSEV